VYLDILLAAWSKYFGHRKLQFLYVWPFFLSVIEAQYKPPYFNAELVWCVLSIFTTQNLFFFHIFGILLLLFILLHM